MARIIIPTKHTKGGNFIILEHNPLRDDWTYQKFSHNKELLADGSTTGFSQTGTYPAPLSRESLYNLIVADLTDEGKHAYTLVLDTLKNYEDTK